MRKPSCFSLCVIVAMLLICGCAFTQPQKTVILNLAAQNCGFLLAQEGPELVMGALEYSNYTLEVLQPEGYTRLVFYRWAEGVLDILKLDPFLKMNFKEMVKLVEIEILLTENQQEISQLVYDVMQSFIAGIRAGR